MAWPHYLPTIKQKGALPLIKENANLTGWLRHMIEQIEKLKERNLDLVDLCKNKDRDLHEDEQEIKHL
jgi:hypothetical protein